MGEKIIEAISEMQEEESIKIVKEMLEDGVAPMNIMAKCKDAMEIVGERYEKGEYFVPQLIMAGEIMTQISDLTKEKIGEEETEEEEKIGKILMGTVNGDIHDIGKGIVNFNLEMNGFEVIDLGVNVAAEKYVEAIKEYSPDVVGMSCLLTIAFDPMKQTVDAINEAGLRDKVKIMIGGAPIDDRICEYTGADGWGENAVEAVTLAKKWVKE